MTYLRVPALRRGLMALLLFGLGLAGLELAMRQPLAQRLAAQNDRLAALRLDAAELRSRIDSATRFEEITQQLDQVDTRFRAPVDRSGVIERLTNLSAAAGTRIIHGTNNFGRAQNGVTPVEQDLSIEGPYPAITRFFEELAKIETLTLLRSAEMEANNDGTLVRVKIKLVTLSAGES